MTPKKVYSIFKINLPWVLLSLTALFQIHLQNSGLTAWRGGGYGMYSTHHPNRRLIGFEDTSGQIIDRDDIKGTAKCQKETRLEIIQRFPTRARLDALHRCLRHTRKDTRLVVFEPTFDPDSGNYTYREFDANR